MPRRVVFRNGTSNSVAASVEPINECEPRAVQLFRLVFAMTLEINCSMRLLLQEGQATDPLSCSFKRKESSTSFPQSRHLYSYVGMSATSLL